MSNENIKINRSSSTCEFNFNEICATHGDPCDKCAK